MFVYDHMWRDIPPPRRGALECFALLGAVAAETRRVQLGPLVARASLRPPAILAHALDTVQRVSGGRLIAGLGAGDSQIKAENDAFGIEFGDVATRLASLVAAVDAVNGRGYPVWVGGSASRVRDAVARADGWNAWGGTAAAFVAERRRCTRSRRRRRSPGADWSCWDGTTSTRPRKRARARSGRT